MRDRCVAAWRHVCLHVTYTHTYLCGIDFILGRLYSLSSLAVQPVSAACMHGAACMFVEHVSWCFDSLIGACFTILTGLYLSVHVCMWEQLGFESVDTS